MQAALAASNLSALLVPSSDPHLSEYVPERWQGRVWLSGFNGSAGTLAVTRDRAALFADSRYWVQAEAQLAGSGIELVRIASASGSEHVDWLAEHAGRGGTVAVDGAVLGLSAARRLRSKLAAAGVALRTDVDVLADVWSDRPELPAEALFEHRAPEATRSRAERLADVRAAMQAVEATHHLVSTLDDLAWIFNLRGADVDFNPVFLGHALIGQERATLFVTDGKVSAELGATLAADGVDVADYAGARAALLALGKEHRLLTDPARVTFGMVEDLACEFVEQVNPSTFAKSRKSDAEAEHVRRVMEQDGAAMCAFYAWFEAAQGSERITELTIDERLSAARAERPGFVGLSFATIAGFNANGALPHYRALPEAHAVIEGDGLLLIDSGGQYLGGTTDITRVWAIGNVTDEQRRDCTLVLKGTIALSRARFPLGTPSPMLDSLARAPLWAESLDYGHGTGHGVGYFLNVHEGPQTISKAAPAPHTAMQPGMITSVEPGLYRPGRWGVRWENLVLNVPAAASEFGEYLEFETLTLCPIDRRCLDRALLRPDELAWLNDYHAQVRQRLAPRVDGAAADWLQRNTEPF